MAKTIKRKSTVKYGSLGLPLKKTRARKPSLTETSIHLQMVQSVIDQLASISTWLKGLSMLWTIACMVVVSALGVPTQTIVAYVIPIIALWVLNGFFFRQERAYKHIYGMVSERSPGLPSLSLSVVDFLDLRPLYGWSWRESTLSVTLIIFYGAQILTLIALTVCVVSFPEGMQYRPAGWGG